MAEVQSKLIVRMVDLLTAPAKKAAASLRRLGAADTAGRAALGTARLTDAIHRNNRALDRARGRLTQSNRDTTARLDRIENKLDRLMEQLLNRQDDVR